LHPSRAHVTIEAVIIRSKSNFLAALLLVALIAGCKPQPEQRVGNDPLSGISSGEASLDTSVQTVSPETAVRAAPCAARLQNIGGALLLYYATKKQMPQNLEELKPFADFDQPIELTCPVSNKPYLYAPNGLTAVGKEKRIVVYDAAPSHNGQRWCLFMVPAGPGNALAVEVRAVPEGLFHTFTPAG
jgi:hypothetical protein